LRLLREKVAIPGYKSSMGQPPSAPLSHTALSTTTMMNAAQTLRAIGQDLETCGPLSSLEIVAMPDVHHVKGVAMVRRGLLGRLLTDSETRNVEISRRYTPSDLDRLDAKGRSLRREEGITPEPGTLAHLLRTIGALVESKDGQLKSVRRKGLQFTISFMGTDATSLVQEYSPTTLHNFYNWLYLQRQHR